MKNRLINLALVVGVLALVAFPLWTHGPTAAFTGTDGTATSIVRSLDPTYRVWFTPLFATQSTEVQSGLFALQAGLGGLVLGVALGRLSARRPRPPAAAAVTPAVTPELAASAVAASAVVAPAGVVPAAVTPPDALR